MTREWVKKWDPVEHQKVLQRNTFYGYNVWGFKDESWRELIVGADPNQPDVEEEGPEVVKFGIFPQ